MSHAVIKKNIDRLLKEKDWRVAKLDKKLGSSRAASNIVRGTSKNPTIEVLSAIANAFGVEVQDLIREPQQDIAKLNLNLLSECCQLVIDEIMEAKITPPPSFDKIISIIREVYEYGTHLGLQEMDKNFVTWTIHKHFGD